MSSSPVSPAISTGACLRVTKAIELDPSSVAAYITRRAAYVELRQLDLAIADETKAIELDPNRASAYSNRASAREADNQLELAIAHSSSGAFVALADDDSISGSAHVNNIALDIVGAPLRGTVALVVTAFGLDKSARGNRSSASTLSVCVPERIVTTTTSNSCNDLSHWLRGSQNAGFFVADSPTGNVGISTTSPPTR